MGRMELSVALEVLRACRLWSEASEVAVRGLLDAAVIRDVEAGEVLAEAGAPADSFGVLLAGEARVYHLGMDGRRMDFEILKASEPLAAIAALAGGRYPAFIEAIEPSTVAWLPRSALFELLEREPRVARAIITDLASRLVDFSSQVQTLRLDVPSRVAGHLLHLALSSGTKSQGGVEFVLGRSKADVAAAVGTVPETLSRALAKLAEEGIIKVEGQKITVLDVRSLAERGSGWSKS